MSPVIDLIGSAKGYGWGKLSGPGNWISLYGGSDVEYPYSISADSLGNSYAFGMFYDTAYGGLMIKYNASGVIEWQKELESVYFNKGKFYNNKLYACGRITGEETCIIAQFDTSGNIEWQRKLSLTSQVVWGQDIIADSSGNVYVTGISTPSGLESLFIAKYNSSGTLQWQRQANISGVQTDGYGITVDSSGNVYVVGRTIVTNYNMLIMKYNSSGTLQWQRRLSLTGQSLFGYGIVIDSSDNVYVCGRNTSNGGTIQLAKYDTSGTIQWQRTLGSSITDETGEYLAIDSSNNIYVVGGCQDYSAIAIAKYNSSGTIQWQRSLESTGAERGYGISVDSEALYVTGYTDAPGNTNGVIAKLPLDGSKTGTYTVGSYSFIYSATSFTDSASTNTDSTGGTTESAASMTSSTPSYTVANLTNPYSTTTI